MSSRAAACPDSSATTWPTWYKATSASGVPIVFAETLGYRGTNFTGHETVVRAILDQYVAKLAGPRPEIRKRLVNVWSLLPYQNPFWRGDLAEIRRILEGIGLTVNILFGPASAGLSEWRAIPSAELNIVLSPWLGLSIARRLEAAYGQRVLHEPAIPIGARATGAFLRRVGEAVGVDPDRVENFIRQEERTYYHYLRDFAQFYAGCTSQYRLPSEVNIVGESAYALAIAKFLVGDLGLNPGVFVLTENPPDNERAAIVEAFRDLAPGIDGEPLFEPDGHKRPRIDRRPSTRRGISDRVRIDLGRGRRRRDRRAAGRDQLSGDRRSGAGPHLRRLSRRAAAP